MVLQTERYSGGGAGGYQQQSYSSYQEYDGRIPDGHYSNFPTSHTAPYSTYPSGPAQYQQPGWSTGGDYHGNGGHYPGAVKPSPGAYGSSHYGNPHSQGSPHGYGGQHGHGGQHGYGSPPGHGTPHGYGSPPGHGSPHGYESPHKHGNSNGYGGGATNLLNKLTHGNNNYGGANLGFGHSPSGFNHGYNQKPSWVLKGLDDE